MEFEAEVMHESFPEYKEHLEANRDKFPPHVYEFAIDPDRHSLDSPRSLHDSWMTSITIKENRNEHRPFHPEPTIELVLLGQAHDRDIVIRYAGVESYQIEGSKNQYNPSDTHLGDVSCHEVRLSENGLVVHDILFASQSKIVIVCEAFECSEVLRP